MTDKTNVWKIKIEFTTVEPSLHEVWKYLNNLPLLLRKVDIIHEGTAIAGKGEDK